MQLWAGLDSVSSPINCSIISGIMTKICQPSPGTLQSGRSEKTRQSNFKRKSEKNVYTYFLIRWEILLLQRRVCTKFFDKRSSLIFSNWPNSGLSIKELLLFYSYKNNRQQRKKNICKILIAGSPDASMSSVLWAKTQQLQEDAFRQLQNIYGEE